MHVYLCVSCMQPTPPPEVKKGWGRSKFLIFLACNFVPLGLGVFLFRQASDEKTAAEEERLPLDVEGVVGEAMKVIRANATCMALYTDKNGFPSSCRPAAEAS